MKNEVIHFEKTIDRLNFLRGKHTEIKPKEVKKPKTKKKAKKKEDSDAVQVD